MLRDDLRDSDIPRRTHIRTRVAAIWDEHIAKLEREMTVRSLHCRKNRMLTFSLYPVSPRENFHDHGPLDRSKSVPLYGGNCTLD
jgi:hypothetical protein